LPITLDPPQHAPYRALINPGLSPKRVLPMESFIRETARELIEDFRSRGSCDFPLDYAEHLPVRVFMKLVDLPAEQGSRLKTFVTHLTRPDGSLTMQQVMAGLESFLDPFLRARMEKPGEDMLSQIVNGRVGGVVIPYKDAMAVSVLLLVAGLDTVVNHLSFSMCHLANNPHHVKQLVDNPRLIPAAVEEFARRFGVSILVRTVSDDYTLGGVRLARGDLVCAPAFLGGLDAREFVDPLDVVFERQAGNHTTFGNGIHRCPGFFLARTEARITLEEWLNHIPKFSIDRPKKVKMSGGLAGAVLSLPLRWEVRASA
jgi:camphor 5-monooxygenase